jgi:Aspartyl protease
VDTGASTTLLATSVARASGVALSPPSRVRDSSLEVVALNIGHARQLRFGNFEVQSAEVAVGNIAKEVGAGLLGEEYLSWNFGVIDVGGMNLYLRPPESTSAKKH